MDDSGGGGGEMGKLSKKLAERGTPVAGGEVDYRTKSGTAWSHNFLNQKPWHPLSYPNQRRKWIAEQTHANRARRGEEVAREFAQEQEFFQRTALFSRKEKEKVEMMKAVSFMYVRPPGYNAESAKAAEVADEKKRLEPDSAAQDPTNGTAPEMPDTEPDKSQTGGDKKARPKDVFGRALPTGEEFAVLKNAPRLETGLPVRDKPFGIEIRNVRCLRCGAYGHQSGDRECPLKDKIMPNEESRLKRDDPLTAIKVQEGSSEPLKWELKQKPGLSPPRGGYQPDDPNQQIVAEEIFDEYGGFLGGGDIPALLTNFTTKKSKKRSKHRSKNKNHHESKVRHANYSSDSEVEREKKRKSTSKHKKKKRRHSESSSSDSSDSDHHESKIRHANYSSDSEVEREEKRKSTSKHKKKKRRHSESSTSNSSDSDHHESKVRHANYSSDSEVEREKKGKSTSKHKKKKRRRSDSSASDSSDSDQRGQDKHRQDFYHSASGCSDRHHRRRRGKHRKDSSASPSDSSDLRYHRHRKN